MELKKEWPSLILITFMLISVFYFGYESKPTEMGIIIIACAICLSFANISKIQRFKGAGFEAEMKEVGKLVTKTSDLDDEVKIYGDPDQLKLLFKAQGKGWKKSTKAIELPNGCIVQVTTERQRAAGDWTNSEAVAFVPDVKLEALANNTFKITEK